MRKIIVQILAGFIWNKEKRDAFRKKYKYSEIYKQIKNQEKLLNSLLVENSDNKSVFFDLKDKIGSNFDAINTKFEEYTEKLSILENKVNGISSIENKTYSIVSKAVDICNVPKAKGILRQVQMLNLEVLSVIDKICRKYNLRYWLDFGTLLGCIRHKGFIPWDDDIDIGMPADDFQKLCEIIDNETKDSVCYFKKVPSQIGKCLHKDFVPKTDDEWTDFIFWRLKGKLAFATDIFPYYFSNNSKSEIENVLRNGCVIKTKLFENFKDYNDFSYVEQETNKIQKEIISTSGEYLFLGLETRVYQPHIYEVNDVFPLREFDFEGYKFFVPNNFQKILIQTYGNFYDLKECYKN